MKKLLILYLIAFEYLQLGMPRAANAQYSNSFLIAQQLIASGDLLGARVYLKKLSRTGITVSDWEQIRALVLLHPEIGYDLIYSWDKAAVGRSKSPKSLVNETIDQADQALLSSNFLEARTLYEKAAHNLKSRRDQLKWNKSKNSHLLLNVDLLYPHVLHGLARALYGLGNFADALEVYSWIEGNYPKFRQAMFEKMWAAFRSGRVDQALGAIASQRSAYFSKFLEPEAYLVEIYLFIVLCRNQDLQRTLKEIKFYSDELNSNHITYEDWSRSDLETATLLQLVKNAPITNEIPIARSERQSEQRLLISTLQNRFLQERQRLLDQLKSVQAYSQLAITPGMGSGLKPIKKLPSRAEYLKGGLEIWPADTKEEWSDELGNHLFIGESQCTSKPRQSM